MYTAAYLPLAVALLLQADFSFCEQGQAVAAQAEAAHVWPVEGTPLDSQLYSNSTDTEDDDDEAAHPDHSPNDDSPIDVGAAPADTSGGKPDDDKGTTLVDVPLVPGDDDDFDSPEDLLDPSPKDADEDDMEGIAEHAEPVDSSNVDGHVEVGDTSASNAAAAGDVKSGTDQPAAATASSSSMMLGIIIGTVVPVVLLAGAAMFWAFKKHQQPAMEHIFDVEMCPDRVGTDTRPTATHSSTRSIAMTPTSEPNEEFSSVAPS